MVPFLTPQQADWEAIAQGSRPHTRHSLKKRTGHPFYDWWRGRILATNDPAQIRRLYDQKE